MNRHAVNPLATEIDDLKKALDESNESLTNAKKSATIGWLCALCFMLWFMGTSYREKEQPQEQLIRQCVTIAGDLMRHEMEIELERLQR